jgi:simple sugar transport system permease protein
MTKLGHWVKQQARTPGFNSIKASLTSIGFGIIFGLILLFILKPTDAIDGFLRMLFTGITSTNKIGKLFYMASPLIMTGLGVAFAFKTGLFNIGASGQYLMGAFFALFSAIVWQFPWFLALIMALLGGAIWGAIPGIFKALLNVNEVITSIMFNWIGLFTVNLLIANTPKMIATYYGAQNGDRTANLQQANPEAIIPTLGLDKVFSGNMNISIFLAIIFAIVVFIILDKTIFGFELKAVGYNRHASKYAGINEKRNIILSMTISGALAGFGGGLYYLSGVASYTILKVLQPMGFNGIPVALLASSHPIGVIFSALFISYIQIGGEGMQPEFAPEVVSIVISVIIYTSAFALLFREFFGKKERLKKETIEASKEVNS